MRKIAVLMVAMLAFGTMARAVGTGTLNKASGWYPAGTNLVVNASPGTDSTFDTWLGDTNGASIAGSQITIPVTVPKSVTARFSHIIHNITATAGSGGSISPSGTVPVEQGANQSFSITPNANYHVADLVVDSSSVGAITGFTFTNVQAAGHTIAATFAIDQHMVTFAEGANGLRSGGGALVQNINHGSAATVPTINPDTGYNFDGWDSTAYLNVTSNMTITATYSLKTYQVVFDVGANGTYAGTGGALTQQVAHGSSATAPNITPDTGYNFTGWDAPLANITSAQTITAQYSLIDYTVIYLAGANGSISGTQTQTVSHGNSASAVTATPDTGHHFIDWSDALGTAGRTDSNVTSNMTLTANFAIDTHTFTVASSHGTPTPSGVSTSDWNSTVSPVMGDSTVINGTTQYVCTGWIGTGSLTSGSGTNTSFTIQADSTITWQWQTNYWVELNTTGN